VKFGVKIQTEFHTLIHEYSENTKQL